MMDIKENVDTPIKEHSFSFDPGSSKVLALLFPFIIASLIASAVLGVPWISEFVGIRTVGIIALATLTLCVTFLREDFVGNRIFLYLGGMIWFFLLLCEFVMTRKTLIGEAQGGNFSHAVTGLVVVWVFLCSWVAALSLWNPVYLRELFSRRIFSLGVFGVLAVFSAVYSDFPLYSFAWAFKLCLAIVAITIWSYGIANIQDYKQALNVIWMTFFVLSCIPLTQVLGENVNLFAGGRFSGFFSPTGISRIGGTLFLFSILLAALMPEKKTKFQLSSIFGLVILGLGVGKTAIVSCLLAAMIFFSLNGKLRTSLWMAVGLVGFGFFALLLKLPMVDYLINYHQQDTGLSLTGRMELWQASFPTILENIWIGSGYVSSKFSSLTLDGIRWEAGHLHNAYLDVLYNNGVIGLGLILLINFKLITTLVQIIKKSITHTEYHIIGVGLLSLYSFMFINAFAYVPFGGRPHNQFILFMTMYMLAQKLWQIVDEEKRKDEQSLETTS